MINRDSCGTMIKHIHDEMEKNANNAMRPMGLTMAQVGCILLLRDSENECRSLKEIEQIMHVAQSTAAGIVARLEKKGFVEGYSDPNDGRIKMVRLTDSGRDCCEKADNDMRQAEDNLLSPLTETERILFHSLLVKIRDSLT